MVGKRTRTRPWVFGFAAVWLGGCGDDGRGENLPPVLWQSSHFRYAVHADNTYACEGALDTLEAHWAFWHGELGLPDPGFPAILYAQVSAEDLWQHDLCPAGAGACTTGTTIKTNMTFDKHELIHAYLGESMEPPLPLFAEGMAVAFSCDAGLFALPATLPGWRALLDPPEDSPDWIALYPLAGELVTYLHGRFGAAALVGFYGRLGTLTDPDRIADAFVADFGISLDEAWAAATAGGPICVQLWECSRPEIALDGAPHAVDSVCGLHLVPRTLRMPAAGNLWAVVRGAASNFNISPGCGPSSVPGALSLWPGGDFTVLADVPAGTYLVRGGGEVTATRLDAPAVGPTCGDLTPRAVPSDPAGFFLAVPGRRSEARLLFDPPREVVITDNRETSSGPTVRVCADCATDPATCPQASMGVPLRATLAGESRWSMVTNDAGWLTLHLHDPP